MKYKSPGRLLVQLLRLLPNHNAGLCPTSHFPLSPLLSLLLHQIKLSISCLPLFYPFPALPQNLCPKMFAMSRFQYLLLDFFPGRCCTPISFLSPYISKYTFFYTFISWLKTYAYHLCDLSVIFQAYR